MILPQIRIMQEDGWASRPIWTLWKCKKLLLLTEIKHRSSNLQLVTKLSYPNSLVKKISLIKRIQRLLKLSFDLRPGCYGFQIAS